MLYSCTMHLPCEKRDDTYLGYYSNSYKIGNALRRDLARRVKS